MMPDLSTEYELSLDRALVETKHRLHEERERRELERRRDDLAEPKSGPARFLTPRKETLAELRARIEAMEEEMASQKQ